MNSSPGGEATQTFGVRGVMRDAASRVGAVDARGDRRQLLRHVVTARLQHDAEGEREQDEEQNEGDGDPEPAPPGGPGWAGNRQRRDPGDPPARGVADYASGVSAFPVTRLRRLRRTGALRSLVRETR